MPEEPLQKSLDRYDVLDRIAVGGMAEVFLAKAYGAHGFEKTLAIKRILPELASDPEFAARFIAEAKVAVRLSHANVVQVFDFGRIGESLFIAMEYVDGCDLAALLRKFKDEKRQIPLPAAFHIAIEIIRALDFAHGHNVVHRDVSPSNILISRAGEVKLGDFGIAVAASPHKTSAPGPKRVMGKWRYMSPEQARGDTLDTRSDLFSAASVLYELFTTEKLFPGDEAEDILKNIHDMPIPKMSAMRAGLPSRLDEVIGQALARKPIDRPTRPATVLRSLIELSYESSIMATALDVAEAVAAVLPPRAKDGRGALDDVIRKQLVSDHQSVARRTAVTGKPPGTQTSEAREKGEVSTGLFRKIDIDGLSRLDTEAPDQATNTRVAAPRARRASEAPPVEGAAPRGDTDLHALYDASQDKDRRTEVGSPPPVTAPVPKLDAAEIAQREKPGDKSGEKSVTATTAPGGRRRWMIGGGLAVIAVGGIGVWAVTRSPSSTVAASLDARAALAIVDAPVATTTGKVLIVTTPPGAHGTLDGVAFATTPITLDVPLGKQLLLVVERAGNRTEHRSIDAKDISPTVKLRYEMKLDPAPATIAVTTTPPGAKVALDGKPLGDTPLAATEVGAKKQAELTVTKPDFDPIRMRIDLEPGKPFELTRELKAAQRFGKVQINVTGPAVVFVYLNKKNLGQTKTMHGATTFSMPVGKQTLVLETPSKKKKTIVIDVDDKGVTTTDVAM